MKQFFNSLGGKKSSSRLLPFIVVMVALIQSTLVLYWGKDEILQAAVAAGTLFGLIAGSAMLFMFGQKKTEGEQEKIEEQKK